jgi:hypothetical protein
MRIVERTDSSYSPDVEIDENGRVVFARDIPEGEPIRIPSHMLSRIHLANVPKHRP